jgi:RNA polymerase sigma-70 factor (ECF subfamily)
VILAQPAETESSLLQQAQQGNRNAFGELVCRHYDGVVRVVYRMCSDVQLAEDAAQEAFMRAWMKLPSYQPRSPFRNWLYRIAINAACDVLRQKPTEDIENEETAMLTDPIPGPEAALLAKEQAEFVQKAVKALPEAARAVLVLREYGELSYQEIASVLEIPIGTVMSRLNYARNHLRETIQPYRYELEREYA